MKRIISFFMFSGLLAVTSPVCAMQKMPGEGDLRQLSLLLDCLEATLVRIQYSKPNSLCSFNVDVTSINPLYNHIDESIEMCGKVLGRHKPGFIKEQLMEQCAIYCQKYRDLKKAIVHAVIEAGKDID